MFIDNHTKTEQLTGYTKNNKTIKKITSEYCPSTTKGNEIWYTEVSLSPLRHDREHGHAAGHLGQRLGPRLGQCLGPLVGSAILGYLEQPPWQQ